MIGAAIAAGLLGSLGSLGGQFLLNQQQQAFNAQEAQKQRDFELNMSNTAYQRSIADMQKAGVNPNLLMSNGGAASVPTGATASASNGSFNVQMPALSSAFLAAAAKDKNLAQSFFFNERAKAAANAVDAERSARDLKENLMLTKNDYYSSAAAVHGEHAKMLHDENIKRSLSDAELFEKMYLPFKKKRK